MRHPIFSSCRSRYDPRKRPNETGRRRGEKAGEKDGGTRNGGPSARRARKDTAARCRVLASIAFVRTNAKLGGSAPYNPCSASIEKAPQNLGGFFCNLGKVARLFV